MPKKTKKAKERLDKFYNMAKDMGYRSRAAFKLVQINRKYDFLSKTRTLVDLCGAPGSWSQVAAKHMPASSTIVCVDLVKIAPIKGVKTLQGDITLEKTQAKVRQLLEKKKCEVVIHDGAPNVGGTWDKDAFAQNWLTLKACQFACSLLQPDGWFVTKVFRSRDFTRLMWVMKQLFEKVEQFKPAASRQQSAEVFIVCAGFLAPKKIDPKLFGHGVFDPAVEDTQEVDAGDPLGRISAKNKSKVPQGYKEGRMLLYEKETVGHFFNSEDPKAFLENYNELYFEEGVDDELRDHRLTTRDIKECFKDLKLISLWDRNNLLKWVKRIKRERDETLRDELETQKEAERLARPADEDDDERDPERIKAELEDLRKREARQKKRAERKAIDKRMQQAERVGYNPEDYGDDAQQDHFTQFSKVAQEMASAKPELSAADYDANADIGLETEIAGFNIHQKDNQGRDTVMDAAAADADDESGDTDEESGEAASDDEGGAGEKAGGGPMSSIEYFQNMERVLDRQFRGKQDYDTDEDESGDDGADGGAENAEKWINSSEAEDSSTDDGQDGDSDSIAAERGVSGAPDRKRRRTDAAADAVGAAGEVDGPSGISVQQQTRMERRDVQKKEKKKKKKNMKGGFEEVPSAMRDPDTRARTLAIATQMLDRKRKREILEAGIHRFTFADENLPKWFLEDERVHNVRHMPVTKMEVEEQKARFRELNARPSKKVAEAVARRRRRAASKLKQILVKEKNDPRIKGTSAGLTVRKLMRSKQLRWKGKSKGKGDNRSKAEARLQKRREKAGKKKGGKKGKK